ncbi:MAG: hypothetical protein ABEL76_04560 [Bradymonadaceae bacterium]
MKRTRNTKISPRRNAVSTDWRVGDDGTVDRAESDTAFGRWEADLESWAGRCGSDVIRMADRWDRVIAAVAGAGAEGIRVSNAVALSARSVERAGFRRRDGCLEITWPEGRFVSDLDDWGSAYLEMHGRESPSRLCAFAASGRPLVEFLLAAEQVERLAHHLPALEHDCQRPHPPPVVSSSGPRVHRSTLKREALHAEWRHGHDTASIDELCRRFRIARSELFDQLDDRWTTKIRRFEIDRFVERLAGAAVSVEVGVVASGTEIRRRAELRHLRSTRKGLLFDVGDVSVAVDRRRIDGAFVIRKPTGHGIERALEIFHDAEGRDLWMKLPADAGFHAQMTWRSCSVTDPGRSCRDG